jgi:hypothetical protein
MRDSTRIKVQNVLEQVATGVPVLAACRHQKLSTPTFYLHRDRVEREIARSAPANGSVKTVAVEAPVAYGTTIGKQLIEAFERTARADEMKGASDPNDHDAIERNYRVYKALLITYLENLETV